MTEDKFYELLEKGATLTGLLLMSIAIWGECIFLPLKQALN